MQLLTRLTTFSFLFLLLAHPGANAVEHIEDITGYSFPPSPTTTDAASTKSKNFPRFLVAIYLDQTDTMVAEINDEGKLVTAKVGRRLPCGLIVKDIQLSHVDLAKTAKGKVVESVYMPVQF